MHQATPIMAGVLALASLAAVVLYPGRRAPRALGWVFIFALCAMVASCLAGCATTFADMPPKEYQSPGLYAVKTVATADLPKACAGASSVGERQDAPVVGCTKGFITILPNPCEHGDDPWASVACHEFAHNRPNGWGNNHPR